MTAGLCRFVIDIYGMFPISTMLSFLSQLVYVGLIVRYVLAETGKLTNLMKSFQTKHINLTKIMETFSLRY